MKTYPIPMVPGPVKAHPDVLEAYRVDYGSADLEKEYVELYTQTETNLKRILNTRSTVVIQSGEGMLALWGALKSCIKPGDRVLAIATGIFGHGIGEMAAAVGAEVRKVSLPDNATLSDLSECERAISEFTPKMITVVHCETPSGTLNPIDGLGWLKKKHGVPLLYVDAVSSIGGVPVLPDDWHIDLCLGGAQKCLAALPDTCFLCVSDRAWEVVDAVNYVGYDALTPFRTAVADHYFPYTPNWHGTAGLNAGAEAILKEGPENCFKRHAEVAAVCREGLQALGYALFPAPEAICSPTVTAVNLPAGVAWQEFDGRLRRSGLVVGGSYGDRAGKVFRLGHMGTQADMGLVRQALDVLETEIKNLRKQGDRK